MNDRGLAKLGLVQQVLGRFGLREHHRRQIMTEIRSEKIANIVERFSKNLMRAMKVRRHSRTLRALTGEEKGQFSSPPFARPAGNPITRALALEKRV